MKKFKVLIPYFDSGTRKNHRIEYEISAANKENALKLAFEKFNEFEKFSMAAWSRVIDEKSILVEEIS